MNLELFAEWKKTGNKKLLDKIVREEMKLVYHFVHRFIIKHHRDYYEEDLKQSACVGMLKALNSFDPARGTWAAHAWWAMRREVQTTVKELRREIAVPVEQLTQPIDTSADEQDSDEVTTGHRSGFDLPLSVPAVQLEKLLLQERLEQLTPKQRQIVESLLEGKTWQEIAAEEGMDSRYLCAKSRRWLREQNIIPT